MARTDLHVSPWRFEIATGSIAKIEMDVSPRLSGGDVVVNATSHVFRRSEGDDVTDDTVIDTTYTSSTVTVVLSSDQAGTKLLLKVLAIVADDKVEPLLLDIDVVA